MIFKLSCMTWLVPANQPENAKLARKDLQKRKEILLEFLYYIFDSILIPLIRSNFYVTESSQHKNRLFYFRHDVWRSVTETALTNLKASMFEEIRMPDAMRNIGKRPLGFGMIRLLPKGQGVRPITNLRRRTTRVQNGKTILGRSANRILGPVFSMLDYEKRMQPSRVGSALFSVSEIFPKLRDFRTLLEKSGIASCSLYFAKIDVRSCFDTIPQAKVIRVIKSLASQEEYRLLSYAEIKGSTVVGQPARARSSLKPRRNFKALARAEADYSNFDEIVKEHLGARKKNTVFVNTAVPFAYSRDRLLHLLHEHVSNNVIKIGKKLFRQKEGVPQGSVLSSLLCSFFYTELESECLQFLDDSNSLLLRLIDDFLLITLDQLEAQQFLQVMHDGVEKYGVEVNKTKSLTNFESVVNGYRIARIAADADFPYCGTMINPRTLEISKDRARRTDTGESRDGAAMTMANVTVALVDSLTVEGSKSPGATFHRRTLE